MTVYLHDLLDGLRRRWWAVLMGIIATFGLCYAAFTLVPPEQDAKASVLLLPPRSTDGSEGNPYLVMGGLQPAADVLARALNDGQIHQQLAPPHGGQDFDVERDTQSSGPVLVVQVKSTDPAGAVTMLNTVLAAMPGVLDKLQTDVAAPSDALISLSTVASDAQAVPSSKSQTRAILVAIVGGLAATIFGTYLLDGLLVRRKLHRNEARAAKAETQQAALAKSVDQSGDDPYVPTPDHTSKRVLPTRDSVIRQELAARGLSGHSKALDGPVDEDGGGGGGVDDNDDELLPTARGTHHG